MKNKSKSLLFEQHIIHIVKYCHKTTYAAKSCASLLTCMHLTSVVLLLHGMRRRISVTCCLTRDVLFLPD